MRFLIIVKATKASEAGEMPEDALIAEMGAYHEELARAGMLLDGSGLHPSSKGWRVQYDGDRRTVVEGPFDTQNLVAGYTLIQAKSEAEAREWISRYPNPAQRGGAGEIEVRRLFELEDFEQTPAIEKMREAQNAKDAARS
jgi:hypothetical protein